jgi:hypothetical protein
MSAERKRSLDKDELDEDEILGTKKVILLRKNVVAENVIFFKLMPDFFSKPFIEKMCPCFL